jgi:hypothetical protein
MTRYLLTASLAPFVPQVCAAASGAYVLANLGVARTGLKTSIVGYLCPATLEPTTGIVKSNPIEGSLFNSFSCASKLV